MTRFVEKQAEKSNELEEIKHGSVKSFSGRAEVPDYCFDFESRASAVFRLTLRGREAQQLKSSTKSKHTRYQS